MPLSKIKRICTHVLPNIRIKEAERSTLTENSMRKRLLVDGQGALEEGFGLGIASWPLVESYKSIEGGSGVGVVRAERLLVNG